MCVCCVCALRRFRSACALVTVCILDRQEYKEEEDNEDADQTARMHTLILVFVGRTCQKVRTMIGLKYLLLYAIVRPDKEFDLK